MGFAQAGDELGGRVDRRNRGVQLGAIDVFAPWARRNEPRHIFTPGKLLELRKRSFQRFREFQLAGGVGVVQCFANGADVLGP
jgi:hypothetical protein